MHTCTHKVEVQVLLAGDGQAEQVAHEVDEVQLAWLTEAWVEHELVAAAISTHTPPAS